MLHIMFDTFRLILEKKEISTFYSILKIRRHMDFTYVILEFYRN